jgi:serpin B
MSKLGRFLTAALLATILAPLLAGCAAQEAEAQVVASDEERDLAPDAPAADLAALAEGNSAFAFDLYQALKDRDGNLFFSPHSISTALAMTYAGARGETERQMAETLHFALPQERLHRAFNALDMALSSDEEEDFQLHVANAIWGRAGHTFLATFLDVLARNYGAGLRLLDFAKDPEAARQTINQWVSDQTKEKIQDLIPEGGITTDTALVLANAIYFKADWLFPFPEDRTQDGTFTRLNGDPVTVPMMMMAEPQSLNYVAGDGYQALELPYKGERTGMVILLPDAGQFEAFEAGLNAGRVAEILAGMAPQQVQLTLPKFSYEAEIRLAKTLAGMGMPDAFANADFSGMDGEQDLFIDEIFHKAFVAVDEAGTEAAAATGVVMRLTTALPGIQVMVDRPFVFAIRDLETGTILFLGRVLDPSA